MLRRRRGSSVKSGWHPYPGATHAGRGRLPLVRPGRAVGLGAICDLEPQRSDGSGDRSFSVGEFVTLDDGRRVILHEDRGFTIGWRSSESGSGATQGHEHRDTIVRSVLTVVLPDDDACAEDHPWSWLADLARARGLNVTTEDLRGLPYEVILADRVTQWLAGVADRADL